MDIFSTWSFRYFLLSLFFSFLNPLVRLSNFFTVYVRIAENVGANMMAIPWHLKPLYIVSGYLIYTVLQLLVYGIIRLFTSLPFRTFFRAEIWSQLIYLPFIILSYTTLFGSLEGNIIGLILAPLFIGLSAITIPISIIVLIILVIKFSRKQG